ncbi:MAG: hypothetical protein ABJG47_16695 [Ekhidna sp.]
MDKEHFWDKFYFKLIVGYIVGAWTFIEFSSFLLTRLNISLLWIDILLFALIGFIPSIVLLALGENLSATRRTSRVKKMVPILNLIVLIITITISYWGDELGSMSSKISYQDEDGNIVTKTVVKSAFVKTIQVYNIACTEGCDENNEWIEDGLRIAIGINLNQFQGVKTENSGTASESNLQEIIEWVKLRGADYALTGNFRLTNDSIFANIKIYDKKGRVVNSSSYQSVDIFTLSDKIKNTLLDKIDLHPNVRNEVNLPFRSHMTSNLEAFKYFVFGDKTKAIEVDKEFAYAYLFETEYAFLNDLSIDYKRRITASGLPKIGRIPKRDQLKFRAYYFLANGENDKALATFQKYMKMNPGDAKASLDYVVFLSSNGFYEEALDIALKKISKEYDVSFAEISFELSMIGGFTEVARKYIDKYSILLNATNTDIAYGITNLVEKNYDQSLANFQSALLDRPDFYSLDSLAQASKFMGSKNEDELSKMTAATIGNYFPFRSKSSLLKVRQNENSLYVELFGRLPRVAFLTNQNTVLWSTPFYESQLTSSLNLVANSDNVYSSGVMTEKNFEYEPSYTLFLRSNDRLDSALMDLREKNYRKAYQRFSSVFNQDSAYYFANQLAEASLFLQNPDSILFLPNEAISFRSDRDSSFTFTIEPNGDHYVLSAEVDSEDRPLYLTRDGWLVGSENYDVIFQTSKDKDKIVLHQYYYFSNRLKFEYMASFYQLP